MADNPVWERQASDTDKSYEAFSVYRDMGLNRSLEKLRQKLSKESPNYVRVLKEWSSNHKWQERVSEYDKSQASERSKRKERQRIQIEDNVLRDYKTMRKAIDKRAKILADSNYIGEVYELGGLLELMKKADDYARRAVGLPDKITEQKNEHTGVNGGVITVKVVYDDSLPSDEKSNE